MNRNRKRNKKKTVIIVLAATAVIITAAFIAAVFLDVIFLPGYSRPTNREYVDEDKGIKVIQSGREITVYKDEKEIWSLPGDVKAQDCFLGDIDHDKVPDLTVLCWKRGKYGKHRPTWIRHDEIRWSQHIFIYRITDKEVIPRWMASEIGMKAEHIDYRDGILYITDTKGEVTKWKWIHWGLEKL